MNQIHLVEHNIQDSQILWLRNIKIAWRMVDLFEPPQDCVDLSFEVVFEM